MRPLVPHDPPPPDPSALPKPPHEPPHDRFFEEGEEPPERFDLADPAAYFFDTDWKVVPRRWIRQACNHYIPFLKRSWWVNVILGPGWLLAAHPFACGLFILFEPIATMWLTRWSLEHFTQTKVTTHGMKTYGALLYLAISMAMCITIGSMPVTVLIIEIGETLESGEPVYALAFSGALVIVIIAVLAIRGRLTRFAAILIVDRQMKTGQAMRLSWRMWKGRFWSLLAWELLTVLAELVGVAAFWVGIVFVRPFTTLFWSAAYLSALGEFEDQRPEH